MRLGESPADGREPSGVGVVDGCHRELAAGVVDDPEDAGAPEDGGGGTGDEVERAFIAGGSFAEGVRDAIEEYRRVDAGTLAVVPPFVRGRPHCEISHRAPSSLRRTPAPAA
jgi:hypothetical protein